jgi:hypothetical protein
MKNFLLTIGFFSLLFFITFSFLNLVKLIFLYVHLLIIALILDFFIFIVIIVFLEEIVRKIKKIFYR